MTAPVHTPNPDHGVLKRLYHGETRANIVPRWKLWFVISGVFLAIGCGTILARGLNWGIDFTGGTVWQVEQGKASVTDVQSAMQELGYTDSQVQEVTQASGSNEVSFLRVEAEATADPAGATTKALADAAADLRRFEKVVPDPVRGQVRDVEAQLDGIVGPFADPVPDELKAISTQLDIGTKAVKAAKTDAAKATAARASVAKVRTSVDTLSRLEADERAHVSREVTAKLAELTGTPAAQITVDTVGPSWGKQISDKAKNALVVFLLAISIFITIRFELKMAVATVAALFHDLLMVVGMYALFNFPITPATIVALLTMLGFSIYDGIVVFDRINENTKLASRKNRMTYTEMANLSLNQVLMRSLNTSITSLLPIASVLFVGAFILGAATLEEFGLALFLGLISGAYSSIFIATPLLAILKEREPKYRLVREHVEEDRRNAGVTSDDADAPNGPVAAGVASTGTARAIADGQGRNLAAPGSAPRPRKPGKH